MKAIIKVLVFIALINTCKGQVPADSLPGTYSGQYWYANPSTSPWVITEDTLIILNNLDSVNCIAEMVNTNFSGTEPYYTDYYSCNGPNPSNAYMKFYNGDSVRVIVDDYPQPFPNPPISFRFYGRRISGDYNVGLNEEKPFPIKIYPNPFTDFISIETLEPIKSSCKVIDLMGKEVFSGGMSQNGVLNLERLKSGMYFLVLFEGQRILYHGKIVKR